MGDKSPQSKMQPGRLGCAAHSKGVAAVEVFGHAWATTASVCANAWLGVMGGNRE